MARNSTDHYSLAFKPADLIEWADSIAVEVIEFINDYNKKKKKKEKVYPVFCYSGMSGIAHATALAMQLHKLNPEYYFGMAYVRKDNEDSHGDPIEWNNFDSDPGFRKPFLIFVDDFVSTGNTAVRTLTLIIEQCKKFRIPIKWNTITPISKTMSVVTACDRRYGKAMDRAHCYLYNYIMKALKDRKELIEFGRKKEAYDWNAARL